MVFPSPITTSSVREKGVYPTLLSLICYTPNDMLNSVCLVVRSQRQRSCLSTEELKDLLRHRQSSGLKSVEKQILLALETSTLSG